MEKIKTQLKVNQIIKSDKDKWKILSINESQSEIEILVISCGKYAKNYLDKNKKYIAYRHEQLHEDTFPIIWEISSNQMKESLAQMLLFEWENNEFGIELDY